MSGDDRRALLAEKESKKGLQESSGDDRRALLAEKESKKRQRLEAEVNPLPLPTPNPPSGPSDASSEAPILPSPEEKRVIESTSVETESKIDDGSVASHTATSVPDETRKRRLLQRSATILVAPVETYVEENDRTRTTSSAFRLASMKSLGGAAGVSKTGGTGVSEGHHYKETERRQSVRYGSGFVGHTCSMCGAFYSALATSALVATSVGSAAAIGAIDARRMCNCASRHRSKFEQDPPTPPDYWDLSDDDWEDKIRR